MVSGSQVSLRSNKTILINDDSSAGHDAEDLEQAAENLGQVLEEEEPNEEEENEENNDDE